MQHQIVFPFFVEDRGGVYFYSLDSKEWIGPFVTLESLVDCVKPEIVANIAFWLNVPTQQ